MRDRAGPGRAGGMWETPADAEEPSAEPQIDLNSSSAAVHAARAPTEPRWSLTSKTPQ